MWPPPWAAAGLCKVTFGSFGSTAQELPFFLLLFFPPPIHQKISAGILVLCSTDCQGFMHDFSEQSRKPNLLPVGPDSLYWALHPDWEQSIQEFHTSPNLCPGCSIPAWPCRSISLAFTLGWCPADGVMVFKLLVLAAVFCNSETGSELGVTGV